MVFLPKFPKYSLSKIAMSLILIVSSVPASFETMTPIFGTNQTSHRNETGGIHTRSSPPAKSLFSSKLFNPENFLGVNELGTVGGFLKSLGGNSPFPLRESYIAYEQAHPGGPPPTPDSPYGYPTRGQSLDDYFKPSKYPLGLSGGGGGYEYGPKLQNNFPSYYEYQQQPPPPSPSQYKQYYYPHPPPPAPPQQSQPFLRLVKIPGELTLTTTYGGGGTRNDLEISCEFPPYVLIVQQIYWHFIPQPSSFLPPYGTFYDLRNGFAPRVTVTPVTKWKSILRIHDYSPDDYGTYRCVSTAILPDDPPPRPTFSPPFPPYGPPPAPPVSHFLNFPRESLELRSSESKIEAESHEGGEKPASFERDGKLDLLSAPSKKRERKVKFLGRSKREVFGVYAPFFRPHFGVFRVYKEIYFSQGELAAGSDNHENTINTSKENPERVSSSSGSNNGSSNKVSTGNAGKQPKPTGRRFDDSNAIFKRSGKVLF